MLTVLGAPRLKYSLEAEGQTSLASEQKGTAQIPPDAAMNGLTGVASYVGPLHWSAVLENVRSALSC